MVLNFPRARSTDRDVWKIERCLAKIDQAFKINFTYFSSVQVIQKVADDLKHTDTFAYLFIVFSVCFIELSWSYFYSLYIN